MVVELRKITKKEEIMQENEIDMYVVNMEIYFGMIYSVIND